ESGVFTVVVDPKTSEFSFRGATTLPSTRHSDPSVIITCGPCDVATTRNGVMIGSVDPTGSGGKATVPVTAPLLTSTTVRLSAPLLATYKVLPSPASASECGSCPTLIGVRN